MNGLRCRRLRRSRREAEDAVVMAEDIAQLAHALEQWVLGADGADGAGGAS